MRPFFVPALIKSESSQPVVAKALSGLSQTCTINPAVQKQLAVQLVAIGVVKILS